MRVANAIEKMVGLDFKRSRAGRYAFEECAVQSDMKVVDRKGLFESLKGADGVAGTGVVRASEFFR